MKLERQPVERFMINESLRCPVCGEYGYLVSTAKDDMAELLGAICHYCGHFLQRDEIIDILERAAAAERNRIKLR